MSLPSTYCNIYKYFDDAIVFLKEYEWIYNYPNTEVLVQGVFKKIPQEWKDYFKNMGHIIFSDIALHQVKEDCPQSLKIFLYKIRQLSYTSTSYETKHTVSNLTSNIGLSRKKKHEIESLTPVVAEICEQTNTRNIIDIGAGLGYLSYMIAEKYNFSVLAIEGCAKNIELALKAECKRRQDSKVSFYHHFITETSFYEIGEAIENKFQNWDNICMCGLHACADLSAVILDLFLKLKNVKSLVIMPCCYHRLNLENVIGVDEYFKNFPLSDALKSVFEKEKATRFLRRPFLRLACQQTVKSFVNMNEEEHLHHAETFMCRAVLEQAADDFGCDVKRLKRKTGKYKEKEDIFNFYIENLDKTHKLVSRDIGVDPPEIGEVIFKDKMLTIWEKEKENILLFEALTALQNAMQNICENILLQDRVQFMKEKGVKCYIKQITDDKLSPRCHALIAIKD